MSQKKECDIDCHKRELSIVLHLRNLLNFQTSIICSRNAGNGSRSKKRHRSQRMSEEIRWSSIEDWDTAHSQETVSSSSSNRRWWTKTDCFRRFISNKKPSVALKLDSKKKPLKKGYCILAGLRWKSVFLLHDLTKQLHRCKKISSDCDLKEEALLTRLIQLRVTSVRYLLYSVILGGHRLLSR